MHVDVALCVSQLTFCILMGSQHMQLGNWAWSYIMPSIFGSDSDSVQPDNDRVEQ